VRYIFNRSCRACGSAQQAACCYAVCLRVVVSRIYPRSHLTSDLVIPRVLTALTAADDRVDRSLAQAIQQARLGKKMTQKALATLMNEKPQVIAEYESGKAIPNPQLIAKIERALGTRLPRPKKAAKKPTVRYDAFSIHSTAQSHSE
jgi:DNA-binding XRE family transcriptional regulator